MRRFSSVRVARITAPIVAASLFSPFISPVISQTKPAIQVPAVKPTQAQALVQQLLREGKIMRARDVKRGMTGYGLSVFQGVTLEKFPIEIIGVLESVNGGGDFVLFRVTGGTVIKRQSSIVAGMSGSPVYINGKLLGAISIGFGFPKEAIGGITPITEMIATTLPDPAAAKSVATSGTTKPATGNAKKSAGSNAKTQSSTRNAPAKRISLKSMQVLRPLQPLKIAGRNIARVVVSRDRTRLALSGDVRSSTMTMRPATMLLQVSGVSASSLARLQKVMAPYGLEPIAGGGTFGGGMSSQVFNMSSKKSGVRPAFIPGGAIGAQLVSGDMDMTGVGTITYRIGNRVLAFGHPMLGLGNTSLPMTSAYIHDIFPSFQSSFKLASPIQTLGAIQQDTNFAIGGTIGAKADTVPMTVTIRNNTRQILKTYRVQVMKEPTFTPILIQSVASEMIDSTLGKDSDKMVTLSLRMKLKGQPDVVRRNFVYAPGDIVSASLSDLNEVLQVTQTNSFARGAIQRVDVDVNVTPVRKTARIKNIFADRNKIKAGETVRVSVEIEPTTTPGKTFTKTFAFTVPSDAPTGVLRIAAGTSGDYWGLATRVGNAPPDPTNLRELLDAYAKIGAQNQLMVQASTPRTFLLVDRTKVPNPPGSWSRLLRQSLSSSVAAYNDTQTQTANIEYSLSGNQFLAIPVESERRSDEVAPDASGTSAPATAGDTSPLGSTSSTTSGASSASADSDAGDDASVNTTKNGLGAFSPQIFGSQNGADQNDSSVSHGFRSFENALNRGLKGKGFSGQFSPIEYSIPDVTRGAQSDVQRVQSPADPNAPRPKNPIAPGAGEIVKPSPNVPIPSATPTPSATPIATSTASPTATPTVDNGTNLSRPSSSWVQSSALDFTRGDFKGAQVTSEGTIQLSARVRQLATTTETFAWSVAGDKAGNSYIGTGNNARIYKISPSGQSQVIYNGKEVAVTALATDSAGNLYAGVSPNGRVLRFSSNGGAPLTIFQSNDTFIWALKFDDKGRLLVGTGGEKGHLYRIEGVFSTFEFAGDKPVTKVVALSRTVLATVPQKHIRAIATRGNDIFIGTSDDGVLYRVDSTTGKTTALYEVTANSLLSDYAQSAAGAPDSSTGSAGNASIAAASIAGSLAPATTASGTEILAVAALPDGVYFGTASSGTLYRWTESGVTAVYPTPQSSIYALQVAPDGSLVAGTGDKGIVYQFRTGANASDTSGARILEPLQTQALSLAMAPGGDLLIGTGNNAAVYRAALSGINSGSYTSNVFDAKNIVQFGALRVIGSGVSVQTRSGNTVDPDASWSGWQNASSNDLGELRVASPNARYLQYRATLSSTTSSTGNAAKKPQLSRIEVSYRAKNTAPQTAWTAPVGGEYWRATKKLTWVGQDADSDRLRYTLSISSDDGATWKPLELKEATTASLDLDTTKLADGTYRVKVEASDILSNPDDPQTDSQISAPFTVDNTSPTFASSSLDAATLKISAIVTDALSPISGAEYRFVGADKAAEKPTAKATPSATPKPTSSTGNATTKAATAPITLVPAKSDTSIAATTVATATSDDWRAMSASDGIFDSRRETVVAVFEKSELDAARLKFGKDLKVEVRARDAAGNSVTAKINAPAAEAS